METNACCASPLAEAPATIMPRLNATTTLSAIDATMSANHDDAPRITELTAILKIMGDPTWWCAWSAAGVDVSLPRKEEMALAG